MIVRVRWTYLGSIGVGGRLCAFLLFDTDATSFSLLFLAIILNLIFVLMYPFLSLMVCVTSCLHCFFPKLMMVSFTSIPCISFTC